MAQTTTHEALLSAHLSKWPLMHVWGTPVSQEQAKEIILKTDRFFHELCTSYGGNNHLWNAWAREQLGIGPIQKRLEAVQRQRGWEVARARQHDVQERFCLLLGAVPSSYVTNDWASSCYILGPHGWMHPNGALQFSDSIGKYPEVPEVLQEWGALAKAFPYLDLTATLVNEDIEGEPPRYVASFRVQEGDCALLEPVMPPSTPLQCDATVLALPWERRMCSEQGLPDAWIAEFGSLTAPLWEQAWQETEAL